MCLDLSDAGSTDEDVDQSYWGELESESEDSSAEEEEEEEEEMMLPPEDSGIVTPAERYKSRLCSHMKLMTSLT